MIGCASPLFGKEGNTPPTGPIDPATLFTGGLGGAYYNFTDGASLAINADGTGGVPAIGAACRSALDKSGNGNRLRNTVSAVTRRAGGIETNGTGYGLFNMAGFGDWPNIQQPFEVVVCLEQIAFANTDARIIGSNGGAILLQGSTSGAVRFFASNYGSEVNPGLANEFVLDTLLDGANSKQARDGGTFAPMANPGGSSLNALCLGSSAGGDNSTQIRFKHLLIVGRALTPSERAGVVLWMQA